MESLIKCDNVLSTVISDLEVITFEEKCKMLVLKYFFFSFYSFIHISTTRSETIFGDSAISLYSDDIRFNKYNGLYICVPLQKRVIPLIFDRNVKIFFSNIFFFNNV